MRDLCAVNAPITGGLAVEVNMLIEQLQRGSITYGQFVREVGAIDIRRQRAEWERNHK